MDANAVRETASDLPQEPGIYQFETADGVLYVGKAVDLRARVRSYTDPRSDRIRRMVDTAEELDFAVTDTETQALLLEANLIKRHQPRYNVRLTDDKSYPLVQLTNHQIPRIEVTRDPADGSIAFGPYTDKGRVDVVVKALRDVYELRGCSDHTYANRDRPCLDFDIGLCSAPCTNEIDQQSYADDVESVRRFFEGETGILSDPLEREMNSAAQSREFERAATLRDRLDAVRAFHDDAGGTVADAGDERIVDVLGVASTGERATVARLHAERGQLVERDRHGLSVPASSSEEAVPRVLSAFIPQFYAERPLPDAVLVSEQPGDEDLRRWLDAEGVDLRVPGAGREAKLVDLALKNARRRAGEPEEVAALGDELGIDAPARIEGFDVSHTQGTAVVGSNVTILDGSPEKADYRRKKLTDRNDDYANMRALLEWRGARAVEGRDDRPDPDLLVIDGGKGQLQAARDALEAADWNIPVLALAKAEAVVFTPERRYDWADDAPQLLLLQRVRDEAHRFAVRYHQTVRDDVSTVLDELPGVGPALRRRLLRRFGSVDGVRAASVEELRGVPGVGEQTADTVRTRL